MPRPFNPRRISFRPPASLFQPKDGPAAKPTPIDLTSDELEALRLKFVQALDQTAAASRMKISQSTFQRILKSASTKVAAALTYGQAIRIEKLPRRTSHYTPHKTSAS